MQSQKLILTQFFLQETLVFIIKEKKKSQKIKQKNYSYF